MNFKEADIQALAFRKKSFGYNPTDVRDFLKRVGEDYLHYDDIVKERDEFKEQVDILEEKCQTYEALLSTMTKEKETSLLSQSEKQSLEEQKEELRKMQEIQVQITQAIEEKEHKIIEKARKQAEGIVVQAEKKVEAIIHRAMTELETIKLEQLSLEKQVHQHRLNELL